MPDRYIEKSFLLLMVASLLLHIGGFAALYYWPQDQPEMPKEPVFIDLQNMPVPTQSRETPTSKPLPVIEKPKKTQDAETKEKVVRQEAIIDNKNYYNPPKDSQVQTEPRKTIQRAPLRPVVPQPQQVEPGSSVSSLLKPKQNQDKPRSQDDLSIKQNMSKSIEDQIKNKLNNKSKVGGIGVSAETDTALISFVRRFITEANSHLIYPPQALRNGLEGIGKVEVTYNRKGEVVDIHITESADRVFDEAVINAFKKTIVGPLPRAYKHDTVTLPLVYFFQLPPQGQR